MQTCSNAIFFPYDARRTSSSVIIHVKMELMVSWDLVYVSLVIRTTQTENAFASEIITLFRLQYSSELFFSLLPFDGVATFLLLSSVFFFLAYKFCPIKLSIYTVVPFALFAKGTLVTRTTQITRNK